MYMLVLMLESNGESPGKIGSVEHGETKITSPKSLNIPELHHEEASPGNCSAQYPYYGVREQW